MTTTDKASALEQDHLTLKWGTLKEWSFHSAECQALLRAYMELGSSMSAMTQHDTLRQKEIICELIDKGNLEKVFLDWDGVYVSKEQAKEYVLSSK